VGLFCCSCDEQILSLAPEEWFKGAQTAPHDTLYIDFTVTAMAKTGESPEKILSRQTTGEEAREVLLLVIQERLLENN